PVTLLFGPAVSYAVLMVLAMFFTAFSWYYMLSRHLLGRGAGAVLGGLFCGFAPGMVAQSNGHPNLVAQFLVPLLVWRAVRLREPGRWLRNGIVLGLLTIWQAFINEEILFVTALAFGLFLLVYGLRRKAEIRAALRPGLRGLGVAALIAAVVLAYPLYFQFFGPQAYHGMFNGNRNFGADITSFAYFSSHSILGSSLTSGHFAQNASEENSFYGWPLLVLIGALVWWLRRNVAVLALAVVAVVFAVLSFGARLFWHGTHTRIPGPFAALSHVPIFDNIVPTRLALVIIPVFGILLAYGYQQVMTALRGQGPAASSGLPRVLWFAVLVAALVPIVPRPLPVAVKTPTPEFITSGQWHRYITPGHSLVTVPTASSKYIQPIFWSAGTMLDLPVARGYFLVPTVDPKHPNDKRATFGAPRAEFQYLTDSALKTGKVPKIGPADRASALDDLKHWNASIVILQRIPDDQAKFSGILPPVPGGFAALYATTTQILGFPPTYTGGVFLWDVRAITGG
ncbi:MAG: hypothetical protein J2P15_10125, partial [Micromonosporaceae bacterium]|nr:hypothetical protein [Micromonosporaceae bacterium]